MRAKNRNFKKYLRLFDELIRLRIKKLGYYSPEEGPLLAEMTKYWLSLNKLETDYSQRIAEKFWKKMDTKLILKNIRK